MASPSDTSRIEALASQILVYRKLYYTGKPTIPDEAYDALEEELRALDPSHPVLSMVGYTLGRVQGKVAHEPPMLSLAKTYEPADLLAFVRKETTVVGDKFDGMALALEYDAQGRLVRASTRGNGRAGEDVTEHIFHVLHVPKDLGPSALPEGLSLEVRGEVYFPVSAFSPFAERFDSYRNAVPGTFGRKEVDEAVDVLNVLRFCAYDFLLKRSGGAVLDAEETARAIGAGIPSFLARLRWLEARSFYAGLAAGHTRGVPRDLTGEGLATLVKESFELPRDYRIDGLVFRLEDDAAWESLGTTSHHPRGSLAFKQTGDTAVTAIEAIDTNVGRSGKITFRAKLAPVQLSGARITYATLHNADFVSQGGYAPGAQVLIKRSGEVIPAIIGLHEPSREEYVLPALCPCGFDLSRVGPDLFCLEKRKCAHKDQESLVYFVQSLEILGISDRIVARLREAGLLDTPADLFRINVDDLLQVEGFARKSAENAVASIQGRRTLPLATFLTALGLKRGGEVKCREVARRYGTLEAVRAATPENLMQAKGWAQKSAEDFLASLAEKAAVVDDLLTVVTVVPEGVPTFGASAKEHPYFGKSICITGALSRPREEYKDLIERIGGRLVSGVTGKTDFLVSNEASGSSKYQQAVKLGIPVVTEAEFAARLG